MLSKIRIKSDNMSNLTKLNESLYYCDIMTKSTHFKKNQDALNLGENQRKCFSKCVKLWIKLTHFLKKIQSAVF